MLRRMESSIPSIEVLGVPVFKGTMPQALDLVERVAEGGPALVAYVNAHSLNIAHRDRGLLRAPP